MKSRTFLAGVTAALVGLAMVGCAGPAGQFGSGSGGRVDPTNIVECGAHLIAFISTDSVLRVMQEQNDASFTFEGETQRRAVQLAEGHPAAQNIDTLARKVARQRMIDRSNQLAANALSAVQAEQPKSVNDVQAAVWGVIERYWYLSERLCERAGYKFTGIVATATPVHARPVPRPAPANETVESVPESSAGPTDAKTTEQASTERAAASPVAERDKPAVGTPAPQATRTEEPPPQKDLRVTARPSFRLDDKTLPLRVRGIDERKLIDVLTKAKFPTKSEFETKADFEQRLNRWKGSWRHDFGIDDRIAVIKPWVSMAAPLPMLRIDSPSAAYEGYDAESEQMSVRVHQLVLCGYLVGTTVKRGQGYRASNALGTKVDVQEINVAEHCIADKRLPSDGNFKFHVPKERAEKLAKSFSVALIGKLAHPYLTSETRRLGPSVRYPIDVRASTSILHMELEEVWIVDSETGVVYSKARSAPGQ